MQMSSWSHNQKDEAYRKHRSDAEARIAEVPVVEVDAWVAVCDGGGGAGGHPIEFIQLDTTKPHGIATCKYCGLRYRSSKKHSGPPKTDWA